MVGADVVEAAVVRAAVVAEVEVVSAGTKAGA